MIIVFGSINIDLVVPVERLPRPGETVLGPGYTLVPGGKGANQALAAARAGSEVRMVGRTGRDGFADVALADLRAGGVDLSGVAADALPTGCALIPVDGEGRNLIVVAAGANGAARAEQVPDALLVKDAIVVLQMEVPLAENWRLVDRAKARGARVLLNCAPAAAVPPASLARLDWLVVNETEAEILAGRLGLAAADPRAAGRAIATAAQTTVIVTLGGEGAVAYAGGQAWSVGVLPIKPVDTVAAGDAFVGAFAAAIDAGRDLPKALHRASVAGGLACTVAGAQPSLPTKAAIESRIADLPPPKAS
ncbi:MAG TPA: ribokinase [Methylomirabilota bacterium]|nr:ribokinase [Methylomirabilota bacterium]